MLCFVQAVEILDNDYEKYLVYFVDMQFKKCLTKKLKKKQKWFSDVCKFSCFKHCDLSSTLLCKIVGFVLISSHEWFFY